ncbi:MAG TPA: STAS domain-containing protein [Actinocrinis sp.]|nr:STAS domain-containing protein [Actinocrinis sp.]
MRDLYLETVGPYGDCAVLRIVGEIDIYTAPALRERLAELLGTGVKHVVLDTSGISFLDSSGLGVLVSGHKRIRAHDGSLVLVAAQERILQLFRLTGLIRLFPPYPTVSEAIDDDSHWREAIGDGSRSVADWCREHELV